jgi:glutathione peroxidase
MVCPSGMALPLSATRFAGMPVYEHSIKALNGERFDLSSLEGKVALVVNVASRCGLTPQYAELEELQREFGGRGFTVLGVPCNQFGGQEPGSPEEIAEFCDTNYGVTFPLTEKVDVNGSNRHPLYDELTQTPDADGESGDIQWNFEKFLIGLDGQVLNRYAPTVKPRDAGIMNDIAAAL